MNNGSRNCAQALPWNKRMLRPATIGLLLICVLGINGCASRSQIVAVQPKPVRLSPPPPELMEPEVPNLRLRLRQLSGPSPETATGLSGN